MEHKYNHKRLPELVSNLSPLSLKSLDYVLNEILTGKELNPKGQVVISYNGEIERGLIYIFDNILFYDTDYIFVGGQYLSDNQYYLPFYDEELLVLKVLHKLIKNKISPPANKPDKFALERNIHIVNGWYLEEDEQGKKAYIKLNNKVMYIFKNIYSDQYRYFKCLCSYYGKGLLYKEIYEFGQKEQYPTGKVTKVNDLIRRKINFVKKDIKKLPFKIVTSKGLKLILK